MSDEPDSRERLESEVRATVGNLVQYCDVHPVLFDKAKLWLDRQAAITERELCGRCSPYATAKDYMDTIESLTAERDELSHAVDKLRRRVDGMFCLNDLSDKRIKELETKVESLRQQVKALRILNDTFKDVNDRLKRENGELKDRNHELESAFERMDELLTEKQRVIDIQRESFKKLEYEITVLKKKGAM